MGEIIELTKFSTLEFEAILFLKEYTRPETLLPGRFVYVRKQGLCFSNTSGIKYLCDLAVGVSDMPKVNWRFYNIPIVGSDSKVTFDGPYIVRPVRGINDRDLPDVRNCDKHIYYVYSNTLCSSTAGKKKMQDRRKLRTKINDILSELRS